MNELRRLWIEGPAGRLEAALRLASPARGAAVIAHPHPQFGGTLHNPVIFHTDRELWRSGLTTLRLNFRGVGESDGVYDDGRGEVDDVGAALSWLRGIAGGLPLVLVGYSFGSVASLRWALRDECVAAVVAIGLPVRAYDLSELARLERPLAVVQGSEDEFGSPDEVRRFFSSARSVRELYVIDGAPHLFPDRAREVALTVLRAVDGVLGGCV